MRFPKMRVATIVDSWNAVDKIEDLWNGSRDKFLAELREKVEGFTKIHVGLHDNKDLILYDAVIALLPKLESQNYGKNTLVNDPLSEMAKNRLWSSTLSAVQETFERFEEVAIGEWDRVYNGPNTREEQRRMGREAHHFLNDHKTGKAERIYRYKMEVWNFDVRVLEDRRKNKGNM